MNTTKSIQLVRDHIIANKEQIIKDIKGEFMHYHTHFDNVDEEVQIEPNLAEEELNPIVKELLGLNTKSALSNIFISERLDMGGYDIKTSRGKCLIIIDKSEPKKPKYEYNLTIFPLKFKPQPHDD